MSGVPRIVDLSHKQNAASIVWPGDPGYNFTILFRGFEESYNIWFVAMNYTMLQSSLSLSLSLPLSLSLSLSLSLVHVEVKFYFLFCIHVYLSNRPHLKMLRSVNS